MHVSTLSVMVGYVGVHVYTLSLACSCTGSMQVLTLPCVCSVWCNLEVLVDTTAVQSWAAAIGSSHNRAAVVGYYVSWKCVWTLR